MLKWKGKPRGWRVLRDKHGGKFMGMHESQIVPLVF